jgi:hypothetical protein
MSKELKALSNGEFTLTETEVENQFYFYRNDGGVLGEVDRLPMEFYQEYIMRKMMEGEVTDIVANNILFETSNDGKCIRLTVSDIGEEPKPKNVSVEEYKTQNGYLYRWYRYEFIDAYGKPTQFHIGNSLVTFIEHDKGSYYLNYRRFTIRDQYGHEGMFGTVGQKGNFEYPYF